MVQDATPASLREGGAEDPETDQIELGFYNIQDGQKGRDGGPYLDHVERQASEIVRAFHEEREPEDLNGPLPASVGTVQVTAALVPDNPYSNPSMAAAPGLAQTIDDSTFESDNLADPIQVLPVNTASEPPEDEGEDVFGNEAPKSESPQIDESKPSLVLPSDGAGTTNTAAGSLS